LIKREQSDCAY